MGGYPALMIRPPESPLEQVARVEQLKSAVQGQQLQGLQIQQAQQQLADQKALTQAMIGWDGKNPGDLPMLVLKSGGSGNAAMAAQQHILGLQKTAGEIAKDDAVTQQDRTKTLLEQNDQARGRLESIIGLKDPAEKQAQWDKVVIEKYSCLMFLFRMEYLH